MLYALTCLGSDALCAYKMLFISIYACVGISNDSVPIFKARKYKKKILISPRIEGTGWNIALAVYVVQKENTILITGGELWIYPNNKIQDGLLF